MAGIRLAKLWQSVRDGLQGVFLQPTARLLAVKTTQQTARVGLITDCEALSRASERQTHIYSLVLPVLETALAFRHQTSKTGDFADFLAGSWVAIQHQVPSFVIVESQTNNQSPHPWLLTARHRA